MIFRWIFRHLNARHRAIDLEILWPICKRKARDIDHARAVFAVHAFADEAWLTLGQDEIVRQIDALE